ncbi:MAG TPA: tetratricopeptide repeat protein [Candidatus Limnocylindria bacterium]|nr:tetratricopeptide repeat protein [Candidatus Limnocylindria bacterium]
MSIRFGLVVGLLFAIAVTYLTSINPSRVRVALGGDWTFDIPLMALVAAVFGAGAGLALVLGILRDVVRSYARRRTEPLDGGPRLAPAAHHPPAATEAPREPAGPATAQAGRDALIEGRRFAEALEIQGRVMAAVPREERAAEATVLAGLHYEVGRERIEQGDRAGAISHLKDALRAQPDFVPAALLLGEVHLAAGEPREALRVWERAAEGPQPALPVLARIEQLHRSEGRPTRMISLYQDALARQPDSLALAFGLGRVYFELAMIDEAAEQFQKMEVRAPELPLIHAYLGAILERRGQFRDAMEEYRRALRQSDRVEWPHRCAACGAAHSRWVDRCPACRRWNTSRP